MNRKVVLYGSLLGVCVVLLTILLVSVILQVEDDRKSQDALPKPVEIEELITIDEAPRRARGGKEETKEPAEEIDARAGETEVSEQRIVEIEQFIQDYGPDFVEARAKLKVDDLPELYSMLDDTKHAKQWDTICSLIAYVGPTPSSAVVLTEFARRGEDWEELPNENLPPGEISKRVVGAKWHALQRLGLIDVPRTGRVLRAIATSDQGARAFAAGWVNDHIPVARSDGFQDRVVRRLRTEAAFGLIYTRNAKNVALIRNLYEQMQQEIREGRSSVKDDWYGTLASALTFDHVFATTTPEDFLALPDDKQGELIQKHSDKFYYKP